MSLKLATITKVAKPHSTSQLAERLTRPVRDASSRQPPNAEPGRAQDSTSQPRPSTQIDDAASRDDSDPPPPPLFGTDADASPPVRMPSKTKGVAVIATLAGISFLNTMGSGILVAALPRIAADVALPDSLILWPAAVYALAAGCCLLLFGAAADAIGAKRVWVVGSVLYVVFTVALGLARTGLQVILFRTLLGVSIAMCLPTAVSLISSTFPRGHWRNVAFAMNGMGQPLGYALGLVLGGIFTDTIGWRWAYYMMAGINAVLSTVSLWSLPGVEVTAAAAGAARPEKTVWRKLKEDVDWVGALILSVALGLLMYDLAIVTTSYRSVSSAQSIAILTISMVLLVGFPGWMHRQTKKGRPALIPNALWKNASFTTICVAVFFCWASLNGLEYFTTLYFQKVQGLPALQSSIRFLPHVVMGVLVNVATAFLISRVKVQTLAVVSAVITMVAPPLMATIDIGENYWYAPFWALFLSPVNPDVLFTVSNLVISDSFPAHTQSLAGGVFSEVSQFGNSVGLAVTAAIAASVTEHSTIENRAEALMEGFRAAFWTIFACTALVVVICFFGLRKGGFVGKKDQ